MRANGVLMISLIHRGLWSKTLNEAIHALVCIFLPADIRAPNPGCSWFLFPLPACFHCVSSQCWGRHQPDSSKAGVPPPSAGEEERQEAAAPPEPRLCPASKQPRLAIESLGDKGSAGFSDAPSAGSGPRHSSHHPSACADTGAAPGHSGWAGLATGHEQKACEPFPAPRSHSSPGNAAKEEALCKMRLLTNDREGVAPAHTLFTHGSELAFLQELGWAQSCWFKDTWNKNSRLKGFCSFLACCFFSLASSACPCWMSTSRAGAPLQRSPKYLGKWKKPKVCPTPKKKRLE